MKRLHKYATHRLARRETPQALRSGWRTLIATAQELASPQAWRPHTAVCAHPGRRLGDRARGEDRLLDFQHLLGQARPELFPVEGASVAYLTEGFLRLGKAFATAAAPELRAIIGPALGACAEALADILDGARDAAARAHTARIMGERMED